jgi:translation initiation factor 4G
VDPLFSKEYYIVAKAKQCSLSLIRFISELFKLQMLMECIMHRCIKKLLSHVADPEEEETESLCKLMITVGKDLGKGLDGHLFRTHERFAQE